MPHYYDADENSTYFFDYTPDPANLRASLVEITEAEANVINAAKASQEAAKAEALARLEAEAEIRAARVEMHKEAVDAFLSELEAAQNG